MFISSLTVQAEVKIRFNDQIDQVSLSRLEKNVLKAAAKFKLDQDRTIVLNLNSGGGDLYKTLDFVSRMRQYEGTLGVKIHTRVTSSCESACTVLYTAGSVRRASRYAQFGFHSPAIASRVPRGMSRTQIIEHARDRWISAIQFVDAQLATDLMTKGLLLNDEMTYINAGHLLYGYVTILD